MIDTKDLIYYVNLIILALFLTLRSLDSKRSRGFIAMDQFASPALFPRPRPASRPSFLVQMYSAVVDEGVTQNIDFQQPAPACFGLYASFANNVRRALAGRATRYGLNTAILAVLILGTIVLVEAVSYRHSYRIRPHGEQALDPVPPDDEGRRPAASAGKSPMAFFRPRPARQADSRGPPHNTRRSDGKFTWEVVDAESNPLVAREYGFENYGTVVLEAALKDNPRSRRS